MKDGLSDRIGGTLESPAYNARATNGGDPQGLRRGVLSASPGSSISAPFQAGIWPSVSKLGREDEPDVTYRPVALGALAAFAVLSAVPTRASDTRVIQSDLMVAGSRQVKTVSTGETADAHYFAYTGPSGGVTVKVLICPDAQAGCNVYGGGEAAGATLTRTGDYFYLDTTLDVLGSVHVELVLSGIFGPGFCAGFPEPLSPLRGCYGAGAA